MKYALISAMALLSMACTSMAQRPLTEGELARNAPQSIGVVEGQPMHYRNLNVTVLGNVQLSRSSNAVGSPTFQRSSSTQADAQMELLARIGAYSITRSIPAKAKAMSMPAQATTSKGVSIVHSAPTALVGDAAYLGAVFFNDNQEVGLIGKEIVLKFQNGVIPSQYKNLNIKALITGSDMYVLVANSLNEWTNLLPQLENDPAVSLVEAQIVTHVRSNN